MKITQQGKIIINSYIANTGMGFATVLPILVGAIVDTSGFDRAMIGWIASSNIFGMVAGGIIATLLIGRFRLVKVLQIALFALILADGASIFIHEATPLLVIRFVSGIFGGMIYASALAIFSGLDNPIKAFGIYVIVYCASATVILMSLPYGIAAFGTIAGFVLLIFMSFISLIGTFFIQDLEQVTAKKEFISLEELLRNKKVLIGLLAYFSLQMGGGVVWTYCERIAKEATLDPSFIGLALGLSTLGSLAGGILVMRFGHSKGLKKPLLIGSALMIFGILMLSWARIPALYLISLSMIGGCWAFLIPHFQQIQTQFDTSGKVVSLGTIVNMAGRATGSGIAPLIIGASMFVNVIWIGAASLALSALLILWLFKKS